ncbi:MAG: Ferritin and Dps [Chloroflexi bacterium]|nr:Ferritin and Dps [Chloroflexota bacterium]
MATPMTQTTTKTKFAPARTQIATPTDLKPEEVEAVANAVNPLIADNFALFTKTKNFHWHLSGSHFREYHLMFDEHAESIFAGIDILAERMRKIGATTIRSISHISQMQTIADDNDEFVIPRDMVQRLLADNRHMAEAQRAAIAVCDKNRDTPTGNLLQDILDQTERRIWFLYEVTQGGDHTF